MGANSKSIMKKAVSSYYYYYYSSSSISIADLASCYCAIMLALILLTTASFPDDHHDLDQAGGGSLMLNRPCDEIYVVGEGETLNTISDKCGDPYIVEQNPHIHDPDDVFPGLVIKITPQARPTRS